KSADGYRCDLNLEIAGKPLFFKDFSLSDDGRHLMGTLTIDFATMELEAPRKFGGLIKVDDMLSLFLALQFVKCMLLYKNLIFICKILVFTIINTDFAKDLERSLDYAKAFCVSFFNQGTSFCICVT